MKRYVTIYKTLLVAAIIYLSVHATQIVRADTPTDCSTDLDQADTRYILSGDTAGSCIVTASGVIIDGSSLYTINGDVVTNSNHSINAYDVTLENVTVTGNVVTSGSYYSGVSAGSVTINNSNVGYILSQGYGYASSGGLVNIDHSTTSNIITSSGYGSSAHAGSVTISNYSNTGGIYSSVGSYGQTGSILVSNHSHAGNILSNGGYNYGGGGTGGTVTVEGNSDVGSITAVGGSSYRYTGSGGTVSVSDSVTGTIDIDSPAPNSNYAYNPGYGGNVTISSSGALDISNHTISAAQGNTRGGNRNGTLTLTAVGDIVTNNSTTFSALRDLVIKGNDFGPFGGGVFNPTGFNIAYPVAGSNISCWLPFVNWTQDITGNFTGCQYSFGDLANWNQSAHDWNVAEPWYGASCAGHGNDINAPPKAGTTTMAIRAVSSVTASAVVTFKYSPSRSLYFYNTGSNSIWQTVSNWFTDALHAVLSYATPSNLDKVSVLAPTAPVVDLDTWVQPTLINSGSTGIQFTSSNHASTSVVVNGNATFNGSAINNATTTGLTTFNATSENKGVVKGPAVFNATSINTGRVLSSATFNGDASTNTGTVTGVKTRYYTATTTTTKNFIGWTVVADRAQVDVSGATYNETTIFRTINGGTFVGGPTTVYFWSNGTDPRWTSVSNWYADSATTTPLGHVASTTEAVVVVGSTTPIIDLATSTWHVPSGIDAHTSGLIITSASSHTINTGITGSTTLSGSVVNNGTISGNTYIYGTSHNSGVISGTSHFFDTTYNTGTLSGDAIFNNSSYNTGGGSVSGDATFNDGSYNDTSAGEISGTATFNNTAHNTGTIINDAVFTNNLTENTGNVLGTQTRYWTTATTTTRDFMTTGPWTLVADGVTVTVASSSVFATSTTFDTLHSGHFVGEGLPGATTCSKPLIFPGTYTLSGDITNTCTIQSSGVVIDGGGHTIGHIQLPLPDNAVSNSWIDMTGNALLYHANDAGVIDTVSGQGYFPTGGVVTVSGKLGNGLKFDGSSGYLTIPDTNLPAGTGQESVSFWFKASAKSSLYTPLYNYGTSNFGEEFAIYLTDDYYGSNPDYLRLCVDPYGGGACYQSTSLLNNSWYHVVATYDGQHLSIYVNGTLRNQVSYTTLNIVKSGQATIGGEGGSYINGAIDELSVWNRALSPSDVTSLYNSGNGTSLVGNESGLISLFHLNEGTPAQVPVDSASSTDQVSVSGAVTAITSGKLSNAAHFDGASHLTLSQPITMSYPMTVSFWAKPDNCTQDSFIMESGNGSQGSFQVMLEGNGNGNGAGWAAGNSYAYSNDHGTCTPGVWQYVTAVFENGSSKKIYVNGSLAQTDTASYSNNSNTATVIGSRGNGVEYVYSGALDEFSVWNRALSAGEITTQYNSGSGHILAGNESGLTNLFHFNESQLSSGALTVADSSGQGNNATVAGAGVISSTPGVLGSALHFDGSNSLSLSLAPISGEFSTSIWVKPDNIRNGPYNEVFGTRGPSEYGFDFGFDPSGHIHGDVGDGSNWLTTSADSSFICQPGDWCNIVYVVNQSGYIIYANGAQVGSGSYSGTPLLTDANHKPGVASYKSAGDTANDFIGSVDELAVWSRALSPAEVANIYNTQSAGIAVAGNGYGFDLMNLTADGSITSAGATINIANSTVATVDVSGVNAVGDGQAGGTLNLVNSTAGALMANGGNSTDYGYGGAAGSFSINSSTDISETAHAGSNGPNLGGGQHVGGGNPPPVVSGCTDPSATNYNSGATSDNGSCRYQSSQVRGCTDPGATNYNPNATINSGSCSYPTNQRGVPSGGDNSNNNNNNNNNNAQNTNPGGGGIFSGSIPVNMLGQLNLAPLPRFSFDLGSTSPGTTNFGNVLEGLKSPGSLSLYTTPAFSLQSSIASYLFAPISSSTSALFAKTPGLLTYFKTAGVTTAQDIVNLRKTPIQLTVPQKNIPTGLFTVTASGTPVSIFATANATSRVIETVRVTSGAPLAIHLIPTAKGKVTGIFRGEAIAFTATKNDVVTSLVAPTALGSYVLSTPSSPLPLIIQVVAPSPPKASTPATSPPAVRAFRGLSGWMSSAF